MTTGVRWPRQVAALVGLVAGLMVYSWLHNLAGTDIASATANAQALQSLERSLNLDIEPAANQWLARSPVLTQSAVLYYRLYYLPLAAGTTSRRCRACTSDGRGCAPTPRGWERVAHVHVSRCSPGCSPPG
jgi:hypothetical protein